MNIVEAKNQITRLLRQYKGRVGGSLDSMTRGKIYELFCLSRVVEELNKRGFTIQFVGPTIDFKASPGNIDRKRSYFLLHGPRAQFEIHVDIEVTTLGSRSYNSSNSDRSAYHEIDIVVVDRNLIGKPSHAQLVLGVECKANETFQKSTLREVLGARRELSLLKRERASRLAQACGMSDPKVPAIPNSEYWLAHIDPSSLLYQQSPLTFGIVVHHWCP